MWLARLYIAAGGEPSSKHYFMDGWCCSDASHAENRDPWELARLEFLFLPVGYILKLFCVVLPVGYCEVMFLCFYVSMHAWYGT